MRYYIANFHSTLTTCCFCPSTVSVVGVASPIALTSRQRTALVSQFQISWDKHLGTFAIGSGVGALVALISGVGAFIAPAVSAGVTGAIEWSNEKWRWTDEIKEWLNGL